MIVNRVSGYSFEISKDSIKNITYENALNLEKDGWTIPTLDELKLMYYIKDVAKEFNNDFYWSKDIFKGDLINIISFLNGEESAGLRDNKYSLRLIKIIKQ